MTIIKLIISTIAILNVQYASAVETTWAWSMVQYTDPATKETALIVGIVEEPKFYDDNKTRTNARHGFHRHLERSGLFEKIAGEGIEIETRNTKSNGPFHSEKEAKEYLEAYLKKKYAKLKTTVVPLWRDEASFGDPEFRE